MDQQAAVKLILRQRSDLLGYLWSILRDEHVAEDVFQEVCLAAFGKLEQIADEQHLSRWLRVALRLEALKAIRGGRTRPAAMEPALLDALDDAWEAELAAEKAETIDLLTDCISRLTPRARRLIELRYTEGLSGRSLAERVGGSVNAVYVGLSRAHRAVGDCMKRVLRKEDGVVL